ncbi:MAG: hypothetical protein NPIRA05_16700 [Nitrospirales bacterium]|nr:MAG: hypothetical protein NPIRA05_16700 [Nitrospirales bacterium]
MNQKTLFGLSDHRVKAALAAAESPDATPVEKVEMLMEIAMGLQQKPKSSQDLHHASSLYAKALSLCPADEPLLNARVQARMGTALNSMPQDVPDNLEKARAAFEHAIEVLKYHGSPEELAEAELNLGLTLQTLAGLGRGKISDAINLYLRALRTFTRDRYPMEFTILHNNLATAYLSIPVTDQNGKIREALAVQSFEESLKVVTLVDHPTEYAMLQNNLGNALQYASSSHSVGNNLRAVAAYDEALKVRNSKDTPLGYANTISNKANALRNLPDDIEHPELGNQHNLELVRTYYQQARAIFEQYGESDKVTITHEMLAEVEEELKGHNPSLLSPHGASGNGMLTRN